MASKFRRGAVVYTLNGQRYTVDAVDGATVYCATDNGAETEFSESALFTEAEWAARSDSRSGLVYAKVRRSRAYTLAPAKIDPAAAEQALKKIDRLMPGIFDFVAVTVARRAIAEADDREPVNGLSVTTCRQIFNEATAATRAAIFGSIIGLPAERLIDAGRLGDNLMRAILEKGMAGHAAEFDEFRRRRR